MLPNRIKYILAAQLVLLVTVISTLLISLLLDNWEKVFCYIIALSMYVIMFLLVYLLPEDFDRY